MNPSYVSNMKIGGTAVTPTNKAIGGTNYHTMTRTFAQVNDILWGNNGGNKPRITYDYDTKCPSTYLTDAEKIMSVTVTTVPYVACGENNGGTTNFPDANFRAAVQAYDTRFSSNEDVWATTSTTDNRLERAELQAITTLNVASKGIANIGGLEYMRYLQTLNCSGNSLTALNADYHPSLTTVYCQNNNLAGMTFNQSTSSLKTLNCSGNKFTTLTFANFNALQELRCATQQSASLTKLTLPTGSGNALATLYCNGNSLTALDVSKSTNLVTLGCYVNQIAGTLNLSNHSKLVNLYCDLNKLTKLTLPATATLQNVNCYYNELTGGLDASKNTGLAASYCKAVK
ncbi:MAG: hypothetical protein IKP84_08215 [Prevotella sp.]|nr:hypothetical protein [Prevotella sp.]